jgi:murein DD-endopeptidase MepM/ murein hydrolase activator NlpD
MRDLLRPSLGAIASLFLSMLEPASAEITSSDVLAPIITLTIGDGRYAFYAHLQPGSLRVKPGDKVSRGQVIGLLGNSGNADGPHLHFHIMDGPTPLVAGGLPYAFTAFTGEGRIADEQALATGGPVKIDRGGDALTGAHYTQLPLNLEVIGFPE